MTAHQPIPGLRLSRQETVTHRRVLTMSQRFKSDLVDVKVLYMHSTAKAHLVRSEEGGQDIWIPMSACELRPAPRGSRVATITLPERTAIEKGLI